MRRFFSHRQSRLDWARKLLGVITATLREIFDEAAYSRFLRQNCTEPSSTSYAAFLREQQVAKARRPKCC